MLKTLLQEDERDSVQRGQTFQRLWLRPQDQQSPRTGKAHKTSDPTEAREERHNVFTGPRKTGLAVILIKESGPGHFTRVSWTSSPPGIQILATRSQWRESWVGRGCYLWGGMMQAAHWRLSSRLTSASWSIKHERYGLNCILFSGACILRKRSYE